jgi:hypothetical protein
MDLGRWPRSVTEKRLTVNNMSAARDRGETGNAHDRDTIGDKSGTAEMQHVIKFFVGTLSILFMNTLVIMMI